MDEVMYSVELTAVELALIETALDELVLSRGYDIKNCPGMPPGVLEEWEQQQHNAADLLKKIGLIL